MWSLYLLQIETVSPHPLTGSRDLRDSKCRTKARWQFQTICWFYTRTLYMKGASWKYLLALIWAEGGRFSPYEGPPRVLYVSWKCPPCVAMSEIVKYWESALTEIREHVWGHRVHWKTWSIHWRTCCKNRNSSRTFPNSIDFSKELFRTLCVIKSDLLCCNFRNHAFGFESGFS